MYSYQIYGGMVNFNEYMNEIDFSGFKKLFFRNRKVN